MTYAMNVELLLYTFPHRGTLNYPSNREVLLLRRNESRNDESTAVDLLRMKQIAVKLPAYTLKTGGKMILG